MFDIVIKEIEIYDGKGNDPYIADVGIKDGMICEIGTLNSSSKQTIDGSKKSLCPGFIDTHGHGDITIIMDPSNRYKLEQGVTTEIAGQCGLTVAPVSETYFERNEKSVVSALFNKEKRKKYTTVKKWYNDLETMSIGTNLALFVGHGTIRETVMGHQNVKANLSQIDEMKRLLREAMESGSLGMSSGLAYAPGLFADKEEVIALCKVVAEYDGIYTTHMKNQGDLAIESLNESIEIAKTTGCKLVVSHLKCMGKRNWGKMKTSLEIIKKAREEGIDVFFDVYPYTAGSTSLTVTLPPSAMADGKTGLIEKLKDEKEKNYIKNQILKPTEDWENPIIQNGFDSFLIAKADNTPSAVGKTIQQYANSINKDPFETYFQLLLKNEANVLSINFLMSEDDLILALKDEIGMVGSDGLLIPGDAFTHPRAIGTFPLFFSKYVKKMKLMPLTKAIEKVTSYPAAKYGFKSKGVVEVGYDADLVIIDFEKLKAKADYSNPFQKNEGIEYVIVSGQIAVENNEFTGKLSGKLIRNQ